MVPTENISCVKCPELYLTSDPRQRNDEAVAELFHQLKIQNKVCFAETFLATGNDLLSTLSEINSP